MNAVKKVTRWTPIITMMMVGVFYVGYLGFQSKWGGSWASDPRGFNPIRDIKSLVGHGDIRHWMNNSIYIVIVGVPTELIIRRKRWYIMAIIGMMSSWLLIQELFLDEFGLGASGWLAAMPGLLLMVTAIKATQMMEESRNWAMPWEIMLFPGTIIGGGALISFLEDWRLRDAPDGVSHWGHLLGHFMSGVMALVVFACMIQWVMYAVRDIKKGERIRYA